MSEAPKGKTAAIVSYLTIVGALIAITMNLDPKHAYARFHTRQAFGLHLTFIAFSLFLSVSFNFYVWIGLYGFYFILWVYGFYLALSDKLTPIPLVGQYFQKWFTFIQ